MTFLHVSGLGAETSGEQPALQVPPFPCEQQNVCRLGLGSPWNLGVAICQALSQMALLVQESPLATAWSISSDEFLSMPFWSAGHCSRVQQICLPAVWLWSLNKLGRHPEGQKWPRVASGGLGDMCEGPMAASPGSRHAARCEHQGLDHG